MDNVKDCSSIFGLGRLDEHFSKVRDSSAECDVVDAILLTLGGLEIKS